MLCVFQTGCCCDTCDNNDKLKLASKTMECLHPYFLFLSHCKNLKTKAWENKCQFYTSCMSRKLGLAPREMLFFLEQDV